MELFGDWVEYMLWDFFVSGSESDRDWAEWVAFHLERAGHDVRVEVRDRAPGHNRVHRLDEAVRSSRRTLVLLSPAYLADEALAAALCDYQPPVPVSVIQEQIALAVAEATDLGFVPERFRS